MKKHEIAEKRAALVTEMRSILNAASVQAFLECRRARQVRHPQGAGNWIEADEARATFLEDANACSIGTGAEQRAAADLESNVSIVRILQAGMEAAPSPALEAEYAAETERRTGRKAEGLFVPDEPVRKNALALITPRPALNLSVPITAPTNTSGRCVITCRLAAWAFVFCLV